MHKRIIVLLLVICLCVSFLPMAANATDMSNVEIDDMKTLLFVMGDAIASLKPSLIVTTTFQPSKYDMQVRKLIDYARKSDPFTGNLIYMVEWKIEPNGSQYKVNFNFSYYITEEQYQKLREFAREFANSIQEKSDYDKIKYTHDYLVDNCTYNIDMDGPYNCVFNKQSNCNGYALTFYLIMNECGIPCNYVMGYNHAWNTVKLNGLWYNIDVTWDDTNNKLNYDYFLKGKADWKGHDKNTATAGYEYDQYNELRNWLGTIFYWGWLPALILALFVIWKKRKL